MLSIQSTEQLTGARISGDFWDLDQLINAIYKVTGDENRYYDYQGARQRILGICYNLRHAAQGDHQLEFVSNGLTKSVLTHHEIIFPNKNVYYATEVLWPELIFTAIALNDFIRLHQELIDSSEWNIYIATIRKFQATVAECLEQELEDDEYIALKSQLMEAAKTTKKALHEIQINANYPEEILW